MEKILLVLLGAYGDCVFATTLARQIKHDHPRAYLIWAISEGCKDILKHNPHVDEVWTVPVHDHDGFGQAWPAIEAETSKLLTRGLVDRVYHVQINPDNYHKYDGTVRPSLFRSYDGNITVPLHNVLVFDDREEENVVAFMKEYSLLEYEHKILFECKAGSNQSHITPEHALEAATLVTRKLSNVCFVLSNNKPVQGATGNIISGHNISYRENAILARHCTQHVGCGSGISALVTSTEFEQPLPTLQLLKKSTSGFASFCHDFEYWGLDSSHFIEVCDTTPVQTAEIILAMCTQGVAQARARFHQPTAIHFEHYISAITRYVIAKGRFTDAARSLSLVVKRYGWRPELIALGQWLLEHLPEEPILLRKAHAQFHLEFIKSVTKALREHGR